MTREPAAVFDEVVKDYPAGWAGRGTLRAVGGVSFRVETGEVVGLLGPNRAGKTTLVKLLLSLCRATSGRVTRLGRPAAETATLARVGYVHENQAFPHYLTAEGLLEYYGAMTLVSAAGVRRRAPVLLERVGLSGRGREPIARFSKGMLQRLGVAQALINDPDLLVLDEPGEGLDLTGRGLIDETVGDQRRRGKSVLLVSHALADVERLCDRVVFVSAGRVTHDGPLDELTRDPAGGRRRPLEMAIRGFYKGAVR